MSAVEEAKALAARHEMLNLAIDLANRVHAGQVDKGCKPYILHPLRVMMKMDTIDEMIVAVLHDVVEDTEFAIAEGGLVEEGIDRALAKEVMILSRVPGELYDDFIERVATSPLATKVKIADLLDNCDITRLDCLTHSSAARLMRYHKALNRLGGLKCLKS